jgi:FkbM family methyltransferase
MAMKPSKARVRQLLNDLTGFDVVRASGQHTLRSHLSVLISTYQIDRVIDVGANEGGFGSLLRDIGFRGAIHSFEPVSSAFQALLGRSAHDPHWDAHNLALGAENTVATINVSKFTQMSSFLPASSCGSGRWPMLAVEAKEQVSVRTLADCYGKGIVPSGGRVLLKMDTQGFDLEVFKGALPVRGEICCLLSELSLLPVYEGMPDFAESIAVYREAGFVVTGFYPITRTESCALNEVDCVLADPLRLPQGR